MNDVQRKPQRATLPGPKAKALIEMIALALECVPGAILVRGHADSVPVKTTHFASNRELSAARAQAAARVIAAKLSQPERVTSEGAGESDPIAPNSSAENRARNRRVVIILGPRS